MSLKRSTGQKYIHPAGKCETNLRSNDINGTLNHFQILFLNDLKLTFVINKAIYGGKQIKSLQSAPRHDLMKKEEGK